MRYGSSYSRPSLGSSLACEKREVSDLPPGLSAPPLAIAPTMRYNSRLYVGRQSRPTR